MKCVILDGAHDKKGMTEVLIKNFIKGVKSTKADAEIIQVDLLNENIKFCRGCNKCSEGNDNKCTIEDNFEKIRNQALDCDVLVFASPIYEYCISSVMKKFLERCVNLVTFKLGPAAKYKAVKGKYGVVLTVTGAPAFINQIFGITRYPKLILTIACKLFRCAKIKRIFAGGMRGDKNTENKWALKVKNFAANISGNF